MDYTSSKVTVATDVVVISPFFKESNNQRKAQEMKMCVLLVKHDGVSGEDLSDGMMKLPGAMVNEGKTLEETITEKVEPKIGVTLKYKEQLYTFDKPDRDYRGRVISVAYLSLAEGGHLEEKCEASRVTEWRELKVLDGKVSIDGGMAFDHGEILQNAYDRMRNKIMWTDVIFYMLPEEFSMAQAQSVYEFFTGEPVQNIRRFLGTKVVPTGEPVKQGAYRPVQLFRRAT